MDCARVERSIAQRAGSSGWLSALAIAAALSGCRSEPAVPRQNLLDDTYVIFAPTDSEDFRTPFRLGGQARACLCTPPPAEFRYRLTVPPRAVLTFAVGVETLVPDRPVGPQDPNRVRFSVKAGVAAPDKEIYSREVPRSRRDEWIEQSVDLHAFSGQEIWLSFETEVPGAAYEVSKDLIGLFSEPVMHDRASYAQGRGVLVISVDTLRRDHLSAYGYKRRTTPGLETLARQSVVFDDAISTSSWTLPAHGSLFTSSYPTRHGAVNYETKIDPGLSSLPKILQDNNFHTAAFVTHLYLSSRYGMDAGFDRHVYLERTRADAIVNQAIGYLNSNGDRDFFLFLHLYDPHWHYDPPSPYDTKFDALYDGDVDGVWWNFKELDANEIDARDLHHIKALYDGEIAFADRHLTRLFQEMKRLGLFDKTLIVVTSDHGEEFLEHGGWEHQKTLYEEQLRVPLLLKPAQSVGGTTIDDPVSLIDVAPTVLDELGIQVPASFQGVSLGDVAAGSSSLSPRALWAETEHTVDGTHLVSLRMGAGKAKVLFRGRGEEFNAVRYDLASDPGEQASPVDASDSLDRLSLFLVEMRDRPARSSVPVELSEEEKSRLRSLGYIQ